MRRQVTVHMGSNTVMLLAGSIDGVHMDDGVGQMGHVM